MTFPYFDILCQSRLDKLCNKLLGLDAAFFGAVFNGLSKVIRVCFGFALIRSVIGL